MQWLVYARWAVLIDWKRLPRVEIVRDEVGGVDEVVPVVVGGVVDARPCIVRNCVLKL